MALVVEDGTGLADAESYVSVAEFKAYADARGLDYAGKSDAQIEQALRRATTWLDAQYGTRFLGLRVRLEQALVLPMTGLFDRAGYAVTWTAVPRQVAAATAEAAVRELAVPGSLTPDVVPGKVKKRVAVEGAVEVEYAIGSGGVGGQMPVLTVIDGIMAGLVGSPRSQYFGRAVRG